MTQDDIIRVSTEALAGQPGLKALFLGGSFGAGLTDAFSDVDLVAVVEPEAAEALASHWTGAVGKIDPVVHEMRRPAGVLLVNLVTESWQRADLHLRASMNGSGYGQDGLRVLFDPDGLHATLPATEPARDPKARLEAIVREFLRILGLTAVGLGRGELVVTASGVFHLQSQLIALFALRTGGAYQGGALHLSRLVSAEQLQVLAGLPAPVAEREAVIVANLAYARAFLPEARAFATEIGAAWPGALADATFRALAERVDPRFGELAGF